LWRRWGIDYSGSWALNPENDVRINTPMGISAYQYNSPWNTNVYQGISYVFPEKVNLDALEFYCAFPTERVTGNIGRASTTLKFAEEDGMGGFCIQFNWLTSCSFSASDWGFGCHADYNTVCVSMDEVCGGWDGSQYHDDPTKVSMTLSSYVGQAQRSNISIIEIIHRSTGGGWSEPRTYSAMLDDFSLAYTEAGPTEFCGNAACDAGETYLNCPADCVSYCGDGLCDTSQENNAICPADCPSGGGYVEPAPKEDEVDQIICNPGVEYQIGETKLITEYKDIEVPLYIREKTSAETCGIDADQDGIMCDLNEDFISCSEDCNVNVAEILCIHRQRCMWTESWFIQVIIIIQLMMLLYMIYLLYLQ
jgi:predicted nucleic acid-binding Zn ribbon protein